MIKKFNWGHGITLFYIFFVGIVATALIASFGVDHTLVVDDYYAHDLAYQEQFIKAKNGKKSNRIIIQQDEQNLTLTFPEASSIEGRVQFYRASDATKDFVYEIYNSTEIINIEGKLKGKWKLKIDWKEGQQEFYKEEIIVL